MGLREREVAELLDETRAELGISAAARERFRMQALRQFYRDYGEQLGGLATRSFDEVERALRKEGRLTRWLDRVWPAPRPDSRRSPAARVAGAARRGGGRHPRRRRAAAARSPRRRLERRRPAADRRGPHDARAAAGRLRPRDRRRGAGPDADAAADGEPPRPRLVHDPRRRRAGDRAGAVPPLGRPAAVPARRRPRPSSPSCATRTASRAS